MELSVNNKLHLKNLITIAQGNQLQELTSDRLSKLLILLDPHIKFDAFFLVLENVQYLYGYIGALKLEGEWKTAQQRILATKETTLTLVANRESFSYNLSHLDINLNSTSKDLRKSTLDRIFKDAPFWAGMACQPVQSTAFNSFYYLLTQWWLCRTAIMATDSRKLINSSLVSAANALRRLANDRSSTNILELPARNLSPEIYASELSKIPADSDVHPVRVFLEDVIDIINNNLELEVEPEDDDVPFDDDEEIVPPPYISIDNEQDLPTDVVPVTRKNSHQLRNVKASKIRQWICQKNQLFPFATNTLSPHAISFLVSKLLQVNTDIQLDREEIEARALLSLMFWCSLDPFRISQIKIAGYPNKQNTEECFDPKTGTIQLSSPWPGIKFQPNEKQENQLHRHSTWIQIPLNDSTLYFINSHLQRTDHKDGRLFALSPDQIEKSVRRLLKKKKKKKTEESYLTITLAQIRNALDQGLSRLAGCDSTTFVLCSGNLVRRAETKIHYAAFPPQKIVDHYLTFRDSVAGTQPTQLELIPSTNDSVVIGTPKRPQQQAIQLTISELIAQTHKKTGSGIEDFIQRHNAYVTYVTLLLLYSVAFREVRHPYIPIEAIDPVTGFCAVLDKDIGYARPIWLPKVCLEQLSNYRDYIDRLIDTQSTDSSHIGLQAQDRSTLFYLSQRTDRIAALAVQPKNLVKHLKSVNYHVPLDSQRHFLKSELQTSGCPHDVLELFLGHCDFGEEGYSYSSGLDPHTYRSELLKYLEPLLDNLGFTAIKGPKRSKWHFQLPARKIPLNPSVQNRKVRSKTVTSKKDRELKKKLINVLPEKIYKTLKSSDLDVLIKIQKKIPDLLCDQKRGDLNQSHLEKFYYSLANKRNKRKTYKQQYFFQRLVYALDQSHQVKYELPPYPLAISPEKSLVHAYIGSQLAQFRELEKALVKDIHAMGNCNPVKSPSHKELHVQMHGQILLSGILYGGLLSAKWIHAVPKALAAAPYLYKDLMWLDLWDNDPTFKSERDRFLSQRDPSRYRRWIPDPLTQVIYIYWQQRQPEILPQDNQIHAQGILRQYIKSLGVELAHGKQMLTQLIALGTANALIRWPPVLVAYAKELFPSASLPHERWIRVLTGNPVEIPESPPHKLIRFSDKDFLLSTQKQHRLDLYHVIIGLPATRRTKTEIIQDIDNHLADKGNELCPIVQLLGQWAQFLLARREFDNTPHKKKGPLAVSTASNYISTIGDVLVETFRSTDPTTMDDLQLKNSYKKLTTIIKRKKYEQTAKATTNREDENLSFLGIMNLFHWFLEVVYEVPYAPIHDILKNFRNRNSHQVSAQLILPSEFDALLQAYNFHSVSRQRLDTIACCIIIIAYRTGLRRAEILGLRLKDVFVDPIMIKVSSHLGRSKKSEQAARNLPEYLFPAEEQQFITEWIQRRKKESDVTSGSYLFTANAFKNEMLDNHELITEIIGRIKEVTKDPGTVLHHCRHSMYTNLTVRSLMKDNSNFTSLPAFVSQDDSLSNSYWNAVMGNTQTGRTKMHAIAMLAGHADVKTGIRSYMHLCDWLVGCLNRSADNTPTLSAGALSTLLDISESQAYNLQRMRGFPISHLKKICENNESHFRSIAESKSKLTNRKTSKKKIARESQQPNNDLDFEPAVRNLDKRLKRKLALVDLDHINNKVRSEHKSTINKTITIAEDLQPRIKSGWLECTKPQTLRDLVWMLEALSIDTTDIRILYHVSRWQNTNQVNNAIDQWRKKFPKLSLKIAETKSKNKKGLVKIDLKIKFEIIIEYLRNIKILSLFI